MYVPPWKEIESILLNTDYNAQLLLRALIICILSTKKLSNDYFYRELLHFPLMFFTVQIILLN